MTEVNPTPQDREMAEKLFDDTLADVGRYAEWGTPSLREASIRDFAQAITTARLQGRREALEEAARVAEEQAKVFASDEYATGQPFSSFGERFACGRIAEEIRKLGEA